MSSQSFEDTQQLSSPGLSQLPGRGAHLQAGGVLKKIVVSAGTQQQPYIHEIKPIGRKNLINMKSYQEDYEDICSKTAVTIFTLHMTGKKKNPKTF